MMALQSVRIVDLHCDRSKGSGWVGKRRSSAVPCTDEAAQLRLPSHAALEQVEAIVFAGRAQLSNSLPPYLAGCDFDAEILC